jgi:hypothetical protein
MHISCCSLWRVCVCILRLRPATKSVSSTVVTLSSLNISCCRLSLVTLKVFHLCFSRSKSTALWTTEQTYHGIYVCIYVCTPACVVYVRISYIHTLVCMQYTHKMVSVTLTPGPRCRYQTILLEGPYIHVSRKLSYSAERRKSRSRSRSRSRSQVTVTVMVMVLY